MTTAICTRCGGMKFGAFCPCKLCGFTPNSASERAKSVQFSDHHFSLDELKMLGKAVQSGQRMEYDSSSLAVYERALACLESDPKALQCTVCGEDLDSFDETLCPGCRCMRKTGR